MRKWRCPDRAWLLVQIVSGLVKFVPVEKMQQRKVVVLCNLKPAKMRDVLSSGMVKPSFLYIHASAAEHVLLIICFALRSAASVLTEIKSVVQVLCASNAAHDQVDPVVPPQDAEIGDRIRFEGFDGEPDAQLNPKKKIFEKLADDLVTNAGTPWIFKNSRKKERWAHTCPSFILSNPGK